MSKSCCFTCKAHTALKCCSKCQAVQYCSKSCQKEDWKQHKQICLFLNVGDGAMQVQSGNHIERYEKNEERFQGDERRLDEDDKRFFKLFTESTLDGSKAAAREMKEIAARKTQRTQKALLFHSIPILMRTDAKKLRWHNSPLRIMLQGANVRLVNSTEEFATGPSLLNYLCSQPDPKDYKFHRNQVILGQQLFRHGANANLDAFQDGLTPLHIACNTSTVTNLDFIQLLLEKGANPNVQDTINGMTPIMSAIPMAPGAAKFLLEWSTPSTTDIDIHITRNRFGFTLLDMVHMTIEELSNQETLHDNPDRQVKHAFLLQQWREIERMLAERGSH